MRERKVWNPVPIYSAAKLTHHFPALWALAVLLKLLAWLSIPIGFVYVLSQKPPGVSAGEIPPLLLLLTLVVSGFVGFGLWAASDFLKLLLCLEYNTDPNRDSR